MSWHAASAYAIFIVNKIVDAYSFSRDTPVYPVTHPKILICHVNFHCLLRKRLASKTHRDPISDVFALSADRQLCNCKREPPPPLCGHVTRYCNPHSARMWKWFWFCTGAVSSLVSAHDCGRHLGWSGRIRTRNSSSLRFLTWWRLTTKQPSTLIGSII